MWTLYWRGNAQLRERIEDELRSPEQPKVKSKKELPDPGAVLDEVTTFVTLAKDGAYMAGDRRVHHTERSRWRLTFRRLAGDALAALQAGNPGPAQRTLVGALNLYSASPGFFDQAQTQQARRFAGEASVAVGIAARLAAQAVLTDQLRASLPPGRSSTRPSA